MPKVLPRLHDVRRFLVTGIAAWAFLCCWPAAWSSAFEVPHLACEPRTYVCDRASSPIIVDGRLDDPAWNSVPWTEDFLDIEGPDQPAPRHRTAVRMLWDDNFFYIAARLEEPHVWGTLTERDAVIYHDNDFEVFIDPDGDNHHYYELEINALGTEWDLMLARPYRDGGPAINAWDIQGLQTAVHVDGTLNDPSDTDQGWSVEIAFPWEVLGQAAGRSAPPESGDIWRVNFSRVQWRSRAEDGRYLKVTDPETGKSLPENNWVWSPQGLIAMHYPEMWGEVLFAVDEEAEFAGAPEHEAILAAASLMPVYYLQKLLYENQGRYASSLEELGLDDATASRWDSEASTYSSFSLPPRWRLSLEPCGDRFIARLVSPHGIATVDQSGRLERNP